MVGFYNYTVVLTYLSLLSGAFGIVNAACSDSVKGLFVSVFCLMFSGFADMFDGKIARTRKRSTESEKKFGIQIDSLCDVICFCVLPATVLAKNAFIAESAAWLRACACAISLLLVLCGLIRLAYFNVVEEERQQNEGTKRRTFFEGFPVTSSALVVPFVFCFGRLFDGRSGDDIINGYTTSRFLLFACAFLLAMAIAYITPVKVRKPQTVGAVIISAVGAAELITLIILFCGKI